MPKKSHIPTGGENSSPGKNSSTTKNSYTRNSSPNNKHGRNFLVHNEKPGFLQFVKDAVARFAKFINTNFSAIMGFWAATYTTWLFIDSGFWHRIDILVIVFCILCISYRKYQDKQQHSSTFDKIANFKRFTHKWDNGRVTVKTAEIQQIIVYLYEVENFLGKPDTGEGHIQPIVTDQDHSGSGQEEN